MDIFVKSGSRLILLACILSVLSLLSGCGYGTKSDINELQKCIDTLTQDNYQLEQRVAALEERLDNQATPKPATAAVTPTPAPGVTPPVHNMTADSICSALLKAGMPVVSFTRYTAENDPDGLIGTNGGYTSRADFKDKNVADEKGIVEVYASAQAAVLRMNALQFTRTQAGETDTETIFCYDNVLMRLPSAFSSEQCLQYEDALRQVLGLIG